MKIDTIKELSQEGACAIEPKKENASPTRLTQYSPGAG